MRLIELLRLVKNNLLRMKFRVMMTSAGVFIGTTAVILLMSLGAGLQRSVLSGFNDIGDLTEMTVNSPGDIFFGGGPAIQQDDIVLNEQAINNFREIPGVLAATPLLRLQASAELRLNRLTGFTSIQGLDTAEYRQFGIEMASGSDSPSQWQALVGARVADNFFNQRTGESGTDLNLQGQTLQLVLTRFSSETGETIERTVRLRVVGVMAESGGERDFSIYMPIRNVQDLNTWATGQRPNVNQDGYSQALLKVESADVATAVEQEITRQGFFVFSFQSVLSGINTVFLIIQIIVGSIGGLALIVAAFGIANTMIMSIYETHPRDWPHESRRRNQSRRHAHLLGRSRHDLVSLGGLGASFLAYCWARLAVSSANSFCWPKSPKRAALLKGLNHSSIPRCGSPSLP